jgi:2-iminobutanoate/2-iminopropanoate deaminase
MHETISTNPERDATLSYSQGVVVRDEKRTLYISGQIGVDGEGAVDPDFSAQARQAWKNLVAVLAGAGMNVKDIVKVTAFLTDRADYAAYAKVRAEFLGDHKPASTLLVVSALALSEWKVEVEAVAARA